MFAVVQVSEVVSLHSFKNGDFHTDEVLDDKTKQSLLIQWHVSLFTIMWGTMKSN